MRRIAGNRNGSVILYVLVVSIVVAVIAASLSQLMLARATLAQRQQSSTTGRAISESTYAILNTAWVPYLPTSTMPSCQDACNLAAGCSNCKSQSGTSATAAGSALPPHCSCWVQCDNVENAAGGQPYIVPTTIVQSCWPSGKPETSPCMTCQLTVTSRPF